VDERAFRREHKCLTLVNHLTHNPVLYVAEGRERTSVDGFWPTLTEEQRDSIAAVAMDMWDPRFPFEISGVVIPELDG